MTRPRIYALLGSSTCLPPRGGDLINEARFFRTLSEFADVYYNGQRFQPEAEDYGLKDIPIEIPSDGYDLYYVRGNKEVFEQLPHPKVCLALPYDEEIYRKADALFTTTGTWADMLTGFSSDYPPRSWLKGWYGDEILVPKCVINIGQTADPAFRQHPDHFETFRYKAMFGFGFIVGYFGRIAPDTVPHTYFEALPKLKETIAHLTTVVAGNITVDIPRNLRVVDRIQYHHMPYALNACDLVLYDCGDDGNWAGSGKVIDAISCGVPIVLPRKVARIEQLGEDYPMFCDSPEELESRVIKYVKDEGFRSEVQARVLELAETFRPRQRAEALKPHLMALFDATQSS
jgi:glycosyltransferase involved in cell wall biosynthesis